MRFSYCPYSTSRIFIIIRDRQPRCDPSHKLVSNFTNWIIEIPLADQAQRVEVTDEDMPARHADETVVLEPLECPVDDLARGSDDIGVFLLRKQAVE